MSTADKADAKYVDLDSLFAASLDDLADLATFEVPPKGAYVFTVTMDQKTINDKPAVEAEFTVLQTVELKDKEAKPSPDGTKFSIAFILGTSIAEGKLKQFLAPFGQHFGTSSIGALVRDHVKDVQIAATLEHRKAKKDSDDPDRVYPDVRNISVA